MITRKDIQQFGERGIMPEEVERQLDRFRRGFPYADIRRPATPGDGILVLSQEEGDRLVRQYEEKAGDYRAGKFVPASGAASRMFKSLFSFYDLCASSHEQETPPEVPEDIEVFFTDLDRFAFYGELKQALANGGEEIEQLLKTHRYGDILKALLFSPGLEYGSLPKGLILFHRYPGHNRTAFEEHLAEGAMYLIAGEPDVAVHFTVSPEHMEKFKKRMEEVRAYFEEKFGVHYRVSYSVQKPSTDTIAVTPDNRPFRLPDGRILFRPGGHGALIENLNDLEEDIVFVKNIDNVVPDRLKGDTVRYKKILGGLLTGLVETIYRWLEKMDTTILSAEETASLAAFITRELWTNLPAGFEGMDIPRKQKVLYDILHRPLRICGMVRNEGEPGGGPFWVAGSDGTLSLQIVESAQIDLEDPEKKDIASRATHFNPVDIVCSLKDHKGRKYDLRKFTDPETYFISAKSFDGKELKALELPGLWNGSMAHWTTLFVEVPPSTFNPVKTVNDLLRPEHLEG